MMLVRSATHEMICTTPAIQPDVHILPVCLAPCDETEISKFFALFQIIHSVPCRYGPHFDDVHVAEKVGNVSAQVGSVAYLNCRIRLLQDKTVNNIIKHLMN